MEPIYKHGTCYSYNCRGLIQIMKSDRFLGLRPIAFTCLLLVALTAYADVSDGQAAVQWLRQHAVPLRTVEAGHGFTDLEPLGQMVGNARIVELGEATHGTREFFQLKDRLVQFLASQKGFTIFSIEANMPEAYRLNDFVLNGVGDPKELLKGLYFWTWNTEEVLDMIMWMRDYNKSGKGRIEFTGFDMQNPTVSIDIVRKFAMSSDPTFYSTTLDPLYKEVSSAQLPNPNGFAVATARLPLQAVAGKRLSLSGYIRSQDIADGYAGLWVRADGAKGAVAFGDMHNKGVTGTSPWTRYEVSIDVPANATAVLFGAVQTGTGAAWVDSLQIEVDGVPYTDQSAFDPGFESSTPRGFYTKGKGYEVVIDATVAQSGKQSLRMRRTALPHPLSEIEDSASSLPGKCSGVVDYLQSNRSRYLRQGTTTPNMDWVIQNARLVLEYTQMQSGAKTRDESMADNVKWIADHNPNAKIIVWAHNGHVSNTGYSGIASMGSYLRTIFGSELANFGFAFNQGTFRAVEVGKGLHDFNLGQAPDDTLDGTLAAVGLPVFAVDLRPLPKNGPVARWFSQPHPSRSIGSIYSDSLAPSLWSNSSANGDFDVLLFVEKTTATRPNQ
jgi:erythromycin esterase-like protein